MNRCAGNKFGYCKRRDIPYKVDPTWDDHLGCNVGGECSKQWESCRSFKTEVEVVK